ASASPALLWLLQRARRSLSRLTAVKINRGSPPSWAKTGLDAPDDASSTLTDQPLQPKRSVWAPKTAALRELPTIDEKVERAILGGKNKPGKLVELAAGDPGSPESLTIHGINADPETVKPFALDAANDGNGVMTFAYDDQ